MLRPRSNGSKDDADLALVELSDEVNDRLVRLVELSLATHEVVALVGKVDKLLHRLLIHLADLLQRLVHRRQIGDQLEKTKN